MPGMTTTLRAHRAPKALLPLALVGAFGALTLAPTYAYAETSPGTVTATYGGVGIGYNKVLDGHAAGTLILKVEGGDTVEAFCIDFNAEIEDNVTKPYTSATYATSGASNVAKAADIAIRHNQVAGKLSDQKAENTAAQLAIWKFTDGKDFKAVPNASIVARATALVAAAKDRAELPASFVLTTAATVTGEGDAAKDTVTTHVKTVGGKPVAGETVKFTVGSQVLSAKTDATGKASVSLDAPDAATTLKVSLDTELPAGSVLVPSGKQAMVTTEDAKVTKLGSVTLPAAPAPKPTPTTPAPTTPAPTTPAPTHTVEEKPTTLPAPPTTVAVPPTATPVPPKVITKGEPPKQLPYTGSLATIGWFAAAVGAAGAGFAGRKYFRRG